MKKSLIKGLIVAAAVMAMVVPAQADIEVNMFGASAQFGYWSTFTPSFMRSAAVGCPRADIYHAQGDPNNDRDNYIAICLDDATIDTNTGTITGAGAGSAAFPNDDVIIRYTTFSSAPGLQAAIGTIVDPDSCGNDSRLMAPYLTTEGTTFEATVWPDPVIECANPPASSTGVGALKCVEVTVGCADTGPECFTQSTSGPLHTQAYDPCDGDGWCWTGSESDWNPSGSEWLERTAPDLTGFDSLQQRSPFIVPFAFFRNDTADHGEALGAITNDAGLRYMNNLTRAQAGLIFSGAVAKWELFLEAADKAGFDDQVMVCIRHAGSGTHATLDWAVIRPFYNMATAARHPDQVLARFGLKPAIMTNKGSSDEMRCVGWNGGLDMDRCSERAVDHNWTAVGYADYDKLGAVFTNDCSNVPTFADVPGNPDICQDDDGVTGDKGRAARLCYQGFEANLENVANCNYDFWGAQVCIFYGADNANGLLTDIMDFAGSTTNPACGSTPVPVDLMLCDREDCTKPIRVKP